MSDTSASFDGYAARWKAPLEDALAASLALPHPLSARLGEAMRYSALSGGKRLRPLLCLLSCEACGGDPRSAMAPACAVELVHAYSLVHDDLPCMDDDDLRRGKPTNHKVYGEAMALLAGDALLTHAFALLATLSAEPARACCLELSRAAGPSGMAEGQAMDMEGVPAEAGIEYLDALYERKTGALITAALRMGGIAAGAGERELSALGLYGARLGLAFQITDDLIDAVGDAAAAGKAVGKDAAKGKRTYPHMLGADGARAKAEAYMEDGLRALDLFGDRAGALRDLAGAVLSRDR